MAAMLDMPFIMALLPAPNQQQQTQKPQNETIVTTTTTTNEFLFPATTIIDKKI
jgi:hypothetical protein